MEVRYAVNDSYMTVLGNPQDPVYVSTVLEVSDNPTPSYMHFLPHVKMSDDERWFYFECSFYFLRSS